MGSEKYPVINYNHLNTRNTTASLLENTIRRKVDLEKILYSYENLHRLPHRVSNFAQRALSSSDPLVLWNYENDFVLNSEDVNGLMREDFTEYPCQEGPSNGMYYNGNNGGGFVNTFNSAFQPVPLPYNCPPAIMGPPPVPEQYIPAPVTVMAGSSPPFSEENMSVPPPPLGMIPLVPIQNNGSPPQSYQPMNNSYVPVTPMMNPSMIPSTVNGPMNPEPMNMAPPSLAYPSFSGTMNSIPMEPVAHHSDQPFTSNCQQSGFNNDLKPSEIVLDANGFAYRRMHITSTVLVPLVQSSSTESHLSYSPGQSQMSTSMVSTQAEYDSSELSRDFRSMMLNESEPTIDVRGGALTVEELSDHDLCSVKTDSCLAPSAASSTTPDIRPDSCETESDDNVIPEVAETTEKTVGQVNQEKPKETSVETVNHPKLSESSSSVLSSNYSDSKASERQITKSTPIQEEVSIRSLSVQEEDEWQEIAKRKTWCSPMKKSSDVIVLSTKPAVMKAEVVEIEEDSETVEPSPSDTKIHKLTKKEKRHKAAQKAKEEETDDYILEQAMKEKTDYLARTGSADSGISSIAEIKKKKRRVRRDIIVEKISVSTSEFKNPTDPKVLSMIGQKVEERAQSLRTVGRPTTHSDPMRHEFLQIVAKFAENFVFAPEGECVLKQYLFDRINVFKRAKNRENIVRVAIYEQIYVNCPYELLPELCCLASLTSDPKFLCHEEAFFLLF
uniref:Histone acetyltransferase n=1 Tax=Caenorhabditis tropicalis TaxID=1561998 RepID=A0A1I7UQ32_9PELO